MHEFIEIMKLHSADPNENIVNLSIHLKDCANFSRNGLAGLLQMINLNFGGVCILNLDFSFNERYFLKKLFFLFFMNKGKKNKEIPAIKKNCALNFKISEISLSISKSKKLN